MPGKVKGYRFMSFYLAPRLDHFDEFFNQVIDPDWLQGSRDPDAAARLAGHLDDLGEV